MRKLFVSVLSLVLASSAFAADPAPTTPAPAAGIGAIRGPEKAQDQAAQENKPKNLFSVNAGVDFTTAYMFRGYKEQDKGLIAQPYATLTLNAPALQNLGGDVSISPYIGTWNSIHSNTSTAHKSPKNWYETDFIGGVNVTKGAFTLGLVYTDYTSPDGSFRDTQEVGATLAYDDTDLDAKLHLPFSLNPHVGIYRELNHSANFKSQKPGTYLEVGIEPSKDVTIASTKVTLSLPTTFGMGFDNYYSNSNGSSTVLGYGSVGVKAQIPLPIPDKFGAWKLTGSVVYLHDFADSGKALNDGHADKVIGTVGVGVSFYGKELAPMKFWKYYVAAFNARPFGIFIPPNWILLVAIGLVGFIEPGFLLVGAGLELAYLFGLSTSARFQSLVDGASLEDARKASQDKITAIITSLPKAYQGRYNAISMRCADIIKQGGESLTDLSQIASGLDRLLWIYVKLLKTAYQLEMVADGAAKKKADLTARVTEYKRQLAALSDAQVDQRSSLEQTLETLESRLTVQREASDKFGFCRTELQRIEEEVELAREQAIVSTEPVAVTRQVSAITSGLASTNNWIKEQQNIFGSLSDELSEPGPILALQR